MLGLMRGAGRAEKFGAILFAILMVYYGGLYFLWSINWNVYDFWMKLIGVPAWRSPFLDIVAVLSWGDCHHAGFNVLQLNPCDPLNRPLGYSPVLLDLPIHWLGVRNATPVGLTIDFVFLAMFSYVLRPQSRRAFVIALFAGLSPAVAFLLERANLDVFDFTLIAAAALFATGGPVRRLVSYFVYFAVGLLKYYPLVLLGLMVRERPRVALVCGCVFGAALIVLLAHYWSTMTQVILPQTRYFGDMFGGVLLPFGVARFFGLSHSFGAAFFVILLVVMALATVRFTGRLESELSAADWDQPSFLLLVVGSALTVGCFLAGTNVGYRASVLLFVIPGLLELQTRTRDRGAHLVYWCAIDAVLLCLWRQFIERGLINAGFVHTNSFSGLIFLVVRETVWWGLVDVLASFVILYVLHSPFWRALTARRAASGAS